MATMSEKTIFQFVNAAPGVSQRSEDRTVIRKRAMKQAAATRRMNGSYGKHNLRQFPIFIFDEDNKSEDSRQNILKASLDESEHTLPYNPFLERVEPQTNKEKSLQKLRRSNSFIQPSTTILPLTEYEKMSLKYGFNILDLSTLATLHVGRATGQILSEDPSQLIHLLRFKQKSFFSYLPSRYEECACLQDATMCVVARVRQIVSSPSENWAETVISLYLKALQGVQKALECPKQRLKPEVLYAIEILALYELLDSSGQDAWIRHAAGASRLIRLRGPKRFDSEFEKALLMAHAGAIAVLNNERCFLEEESWKEVFRSIITSDSPVSDRSEIVISLMNRKSDATGYFVEVTSIICQKTKPSSRAIIELTFKVRQLRAELLQWLGDYQSLLERLPRILPGSIDYEK
ncbi:hypothetical protein MMC13_008262 [Lambiella insularis]|nr:hypothetical protein [Lambiella insularis]